MPRGDIVKDDTKIRRALKILIHSDAIHLRVHPHRIHLPLGQWNHLRLPVSTWIAMH
jgi:hypothetical protein